MTSHSFDSDPLEFVAGGFRHEEFPLVHWHAFARASDLMHLSKSNVKFYVWWNHGCIISTGYQTGNTVPLQFFEVLQPNAPYSPKSIFSPMDCNTKRNGWEDDCNLKRNPTHRVTPWHVVMIGMPTCHLTLTWEVTWPVCLAADCGWSPAYTDARRSAPETA